MHNAPDRRRILAIDDDQAMHGLFAAALRNAPIELRSVQSVNAARLSIAESRPELILLDLNLDGASGFDAIGELRLLAGNGVGILAVSGSCDRGTKEKVRECGCLGMLRKPIRMASFADEVMTFLAGTEFVPGSEETDPVLTKLRRQFLDEMLYQIAELNCRSDEFLLSDRMLQNAAHRWIGASTSIGLPALEVLGRRIGEFAQSHQTGIEAIRTALAETQTLVWQAQASQPS